MLFLPDSLRSTVEGFSTVFNEYRPLLVKQSCRVVRVMGKAGYCSEMTLGEVHGTIYYIHEMQETDK